MGAPKLELGALHHLKATEPPVWLAPSVELSDTVRSASKQLFSFLKAHSPKSPLDQLLIEGFDPEQIWQQIDLLSQPLLSALKRQLKNFEKNPDEIGNIRKVLEGERMDFKSERKVVEEESDGFDDELDDDDDEEEEMKEEGDEPESEEEGNESENKEEGEEKGKGGGIEDEFLKINELEQYLDEDEAREYGLKKNRNNDKKKGGRKVFGDEDEDLDDEDEFDDDDEELGVFGGEGDEDGDVDKLGTARYEDFFGAKKKRVPTKKSKLVDGLEEESGSDEEEDDDVVMKDQKNDHLSTHEKQLKMLQSEIEKMEKENLDTKTWTMQGEVTAAQRPKNSALEVDLDFQHNVRPAPVITEEFTASLEDMIKKRILEGQFDDVIKIPTLPSKAPIELKELDENKSKKGLAEVYEEEYVQKTNPAAAPLSFSDEQKKEASMLFKKLCLKLDALSHFHFTPKPVIEDMSIQTNVPALAMEEIAPIAVSDAAMLAPEEIFTGKGDVKEEAELTQAERKRRRTKKKRKFKAEAAKRTTKRARDNSLLNQNDD